MGGRRENTGGNRASTSGRSGTSREGRGNDAESTRTENTDGLTQYEGSNGTEEISSSTEATTSDLGDVTDKDVAGSGTGSENAEGMDSGSDNENKA